MMINTKSLTNFIKDNCLEDVPCQTEFNAQLVWSVFLDEEHLKEIEYSYYFNEESTIKYLQWSSDSDDCRCEATDLTPIGALFHRINSVDSIKETCALAAALYKYYGQCEDVVSRKVVEDQMFRYGFHAPDMTVTEFVKDLPPVNPQTSEILTEDELFKLIRNHYGIKKDDCCFICVHQANQLGTPKYIATDWGRKKVIYEKGKES